MTYDEYSKARAMTDERQAGLRSAVEDVLTTLERVVTDSESQHPGGWGPDVTTVADLRDCQAVLRAALAVAQVPAQEEPWAWLIFYEDADRQPEVFMGEGAEDAARRRFDAARQTWNCTLFVTLEDATGRDAARRSAQVPVQEERPSGYLPGMTHGTGGNLIPAETQELERLRAVEAAARRFLEAAALESMTKAPGYIKAKRTLRRVLREVSDG